MAIYEHISPSINAPAPTPAPTAAPKAQSSTLTGSGAPTGGNPWDTDPGVAAARAAQARAKAQADAYLRQLRSQALINFGDPSLLKGLGFSVDPSVLAAAKANQYSFVNQLHQSDVTRRRQMMNSLAARGLVASGETGYQAGQEGKWYGGQLYGAEQSLLSNLSGYLQNYLTTTGNADTNYQNAIQNWWTNYLNHPEAYPNPLQPGGGTETGTPGKSAVPSWWEPGWGNYASGT